MRKSKFIGKTIKETPRDAELISHRFMLRGGFMKQFTAGIYGLLPLGLRCIAKIEKICREEMDFLGGQEVRLSCLASREIWEETGRYATFGKDMMKLKDRHGKDMVLNPTHEEPLVSLMRHELSSYRQLPVMLYQIQTKFRDEPRPRGGLIRLREFTMKDAYSFHENEKDLKEYYEKVHEGYRKFYQRLGCKNFVSVMSDNGLFGGRYSHEFQMLAPSGEDTLLTCPHCRYSANEEVATSPFTKAPQKAEEPLQEVSTPGQHTIEDLCKYLNIPASLTAKAVMFQTLHSKQPVICFVRGDLEVVERKVCGLVQEELSAATPDTLIEAGAIKGSTGPLGLNSCLIVLDSTLMETPWLATGANKADTHFIGFQIQRDLFQSLSEFEKKRVKIGDIAKVRQGDPCPECGHELKVSRGIEIGNIFHLGTKYSQSMNCTFIDEQGQAHHPIMGCYGIGITRLLPAIIEESHDEKGPILPLPVAPFEAHLCALNRKEIVKEADDLYAELQAAKIDVFYDDTDGKPGSQFADADLVGIPFRLIISPKTLANNQVEFCYRDKRIAPRLVNRNEIVSLLKQEINAEYALYK